jgi:hypothetical protein
MGHTMVTVFEGHEYRYTEWPHYVGGKVDWSQLAGIELYNHTSDYEENKNIAAAAATMDVTAELRRQLRAGWREAML